MWWPSFGITAGRMSSQRKKGRQTSAANNGEKKELEFSQWNLLPLGFSNSRIPSCLPSLTGQAATPTRLEIPPGALLTGGGVMFSNSARTEVTGWSPATIRSVSYTRLYPCVWRNEDTTILLHALGNRRPKCHHLTKSLSKSKPPSLNPRRRSSPSGRFYNT